MVFEVNDKFRVLMFARQFYCLPGLIVLGTFMSDGMNQLTAAEPSPNILLIITDEHNFRTLGCYRDLLAPEQAEMWGPNTIVETPSFDQIASEGVICTRAYATSPVCSPCRAAMITGMYPHPVSYTHLTLPTILRV